MSADAQAHVRLFPLTDRYMRDTYPRFVLDGWQDDEVLDVRTAEASLALCQGCTGLDGCRQQGSKGIVVVIRPSSKEYRSRIERVVRECKYKRQARELANAPQTPDQGGGACRDFRLDNYERTPGNADALAAARDYVANAKERIAEGVSLIFYGRPGTGKTHLATGILWELLPMGQAVAYITFPQYLDALRARYGTDDPGCVLEIATVPVLIIDDLTVENVTPWVRDLLGVLLDARIQPIRLPTIITLNHSPKEIEAKYTERIASRMGRQFYRWIPVVGKDRRRS